MAQQHLIQLWHNEYVQKGIPSSFKEEPSGPLMKWFPYLNERIHRNGLALDLGCGKGRNSVFLAAQGVHVHSVDFVPELIEDLRQQSKQLDLDNKIYPTCQDLTLSWQFASHTFDLVIDTYCYKHQVEASRKEIYRSELARVTKPGSLYLLTLASVNDGYYGPLLSSSLDPNNRLILDPATGIPSILYTKRDIEREFSSLFELVQYDCERLIGPMHGENYLRETLVFIFSRRN